MDDQIRKDEVEQDVIRMGERRGSYMFLLGEPEEKGQMEFPGLDGSKRASLEGIGLD